ncbi:hypothetical protein [Flavobacterium johnsoniae]|uniref:Uncharacterized protein n=1 Tax=Flavobacterium johnsoniae (strain ATCC 17061 / DSM 2064 / JCM 8514 / BCRC 14874 / CCUG 350202 / NBRC 14942 / NCIMB 11054 / UW101) TaxID=376686 RepID=A5FEU6_FLAJ1|nr:hypothetical protein [Flavobacterium johnsoniae]ABQ06271.1 hypothetical protein Fjoh_3255 [Flavobacterium johnsoniae UW101]OXE98259.1 hypothetical protein B0A63_15020 [Flavobacterium johnsoniae UW101]WQG82019.1 hypothetical protein SR927_02700 [Flavobacterium johnsoniae UW101]SHK70514.1 hypothetical protein SAMN05444146_1994 [Flavobacterium johnsoniae]
MKQILSILLGVILIVLGFRYIFYNIKDYNHNESCNSSEFIADGGRIYISFYRNISKTKMVKNFQIILIGKDGKAKKVEYQRIKDSDTKYYIESKILKSDTLIIETEGDKKYKFFDFKNTASKINAGKNRGEYYCNLYYKSIPSNKDFEDSSENFDTINVFLE